MKVRPLKTRQPRSRLLPPGAPLTTPLAVPRPIGALSRSSGASDQDRLERVEVRGERVPARPLPRPPAQERVVIVIRKRPYDRGGEARDSRRVGGRELAA